MSRSSWDMRWMALAELVAQWSKDRSRKAGAVIVDDRNVVLSLGWNGFPRKIDDDVEERHERPVKYLWTEHAERNAIYNAAANGFKCLGSKMYLNWYPCVPCARAIIQSGISKLVAMEPNWDDYQWKDDFGVTKEMLSEAEVKVNFLGRREDEPLSKNS